MVSESPIDTFNTSNSISFFLYNLRIYTYFVHAVYAILRLLSSLLIFNLTVMTSQINFHVVGDKVSVFLVFLVGGLQEVVIHVAIQVQKTCCDIKLETG